MLITKEIEFDMGHRVPYHKSKCKNPHGHRYKIEVRLEGDVIDMEGESENGMVMDFKDIKAVLMKEVDERLDHGFMYWEKDEPMKEFFSIYKDFHSIEVPFTPTAENIAQYLFNILQDKYKDIYNTGLKLIEVKLWETPTSVAIARLK